MNSFAKIRLSLFFLLALSTVQGQESTLIQNINFRAKELKHNLNKLGDSLILRCDRTIYVVNLFNKDRDLSFEINNKEAAIPLKDLAVGRYVVEAMLYDKRIILTLLRNKPYTDRVRQLEVIETVTAVKDIDITQEIFTAEIEEITADVISTKAEESIIETKPIDTDKNIENTQEETPTYNTENIGDLLNYKRKIVPKTKPKEKKKKRNYLYWVHREISSGHVSRISKRMATLKEVERMIERNQLDIKTLKGKSNTLIIWEVNNPKMFYKEKVLDNNYLQKPSPYFKFKPYYTTDSYGLDISHN